MGRARLVVGAQQGDDSNSWQNVEQVEAAAAMSFGPLSPDQIWLNWLVWRAYGRQGDVLSATSRQRIVLASSRRCPAVSAQYEVKILDIGRGGDSRLLTLGMLGGNSEG